MRQIFKNRFIKPYFFGSSNELSRFVRNLGEVKELWLEDSVGANYVCYVCRESLSGEVIFCLSFCSEEEVNDLNLIHWSKANLMVVETGKTVQLINEDLIVIKVLDLTYPVIGFQITPMNNLLVLEEGSMRLVDFEGKVLMEKVFDLIEDFELDGNTLIVKTAEGIESVKLQ